MPVGQDGPVASSCNSADPLSRNMRESPQALTSSKPYRTPDEKRAASRRKRRVECGFRPCRAGACPRRAGDQPPMNGCLSPAERAHSLLSGRSSPTERKRVPRRTGACPTSCGRVCPRGAGACPQAERARIPAVRAISRSAGRPELFRCHRNYSAAARAIPPDRSRRAPR